jgi:hypothetical protein
MTQTNVVLESNATSGNGDPTVTPEGNGSAAGVQPALPVPSDVNADVAASDREKETGFTDTAVEVTDVSLFFSANASTSGHNNVNDRMHMGSSNSGFVFIPQSH